MIDASIQFMINVFIIFMLFWMWFWNLPDTNPIKNWLIPKIKKPFEFVGLRHGWGMFSPNPSRRNINLLVKFIMQDDSIILWRPRPNESLNTLKKIRNKKFTKFFTATMKAKKSYLVSKSFAKYLYRNHKPAGICKRMEIVKEWQKIPPFEDQKSIYPIKQTLIYSFDPTKNFRK